MNQKKLLICGLPGSGKTTFLAALWYLLTNDEASTALELGGWPNNREYLNNLARKWSCFVEVDRTPTKEMREIQLELKNDHMEVELIAPDMSGETWESLWTDRSCTNKVAEWSKDACGIMLFLHADKIEPPLDISTVNAMAGNTPGDRNYNENNEWVAASAPTQVILVDILQSLSRFPLCHEVRNLAIVISAWDMVSERGLSPEEYLCSEMPLLHQYLKCSGDYIQYKIYGVSALGGDLNSPSENDRIKALDVPSERIKVVQGGCSDTSEFDNDLTAPIQWLFEPQNYNQDQE